MFEWDTSRQPASRAQDFGGAVPLTINPKDTLTFDDGSVLAVDQLSWQVQNVLQFDPLSVTRSVRPGAFEVTADAGAALPGLLHAAATKSLLRGVIELRDEGRVWRLEGVRVTSVRVHEPVGDRPPVVVFTLTFETLTLATTDLTDRATRSAAGNAATAPARVELVAEALSLIHI